MKRQMSPAAALSRLQEMCARAEHCSSEIAAKLARWQIEPDVSRKIIDSLVDNRFVDDNRFAGAYTTDKLRFSGWGRYKIIRGLAAKRIPRQAVDKALERIDPEEYRQVCRHLLIVKARSIREGNTREGKTKLFRFGAARGFEPALVASIIRAENLWEPADD